MARLELVEKGASKFWEIRREGTHLHVTWGEIGKKGQSHVKSFPTDAAAESAMESLIAEKTKKGYREGAARRSSTATSTIASRSGAGIGAPPMALIMPAGSTEVDSVLARDGLSARAPH